MQKSWRRPSFQDNYNIYFYSQKIFIRPRRLSPALLHKKDLPGVFQSNNTFHRYLKFLAYRIPSTGQLLRDCCCNNFKGLLHLGVLPQVHRFLKHVTDILQIFCSQIPSKGFIARKFSQVFYAQKTFHRSSTQKIFRRCFTTNSIDRISPKVF